MNRTCFVLLASLVGSFLFSADAQAGKKLYVGNLPVSPTDRFGVFDPSTTPPTEVQDLGIALQGAQTGTVQNPGNPLPASSSVAILNQGPDGLGDAGVLNVFYNGSPGAFPANSFFDVFLDITDPGTGQPAAMKKGTVKFFNETKGFGMVVSGQVPGQPEYLYSLTGQINPAQTGLRFADVPAVPGGPNGDSFFDVFTELSFDGSGTIDPSVSLFSITLTPVPEPSSLALAALGAFGLMIVARRKLTANSLTSRRAFCRACSMD